ncbi:MAG: winged helix-turn-helix domain-containing protein [Mycobacteriales bacterium]
MRASELSAAQARRVALTAQGFAHRARGGRTRKQILQISRRLHALQFDTVNVLVRAHYLPVYSRLGPYPLAILDRLTNETHDLVENCTHQASFGPVELEPLLRWRSAEPGNQWSKLWRNRVDPAYVDAVERQVAERGPLTLGDLDDRRRHEKKPATELGLRRRDGQPYAESSLRWHRPSDGKIVFDGLCAEGRLASAGRRGTERLYDLAERVVPAAVREAPTPARQDAQRQLVMLAAPALGVATVADLANYFQLKAADTKVAVRDLVSAGALAEVRVEGWKGPCYLDSAAALPTRLDARALIGPFDSLTWSRERTRRLFGFQFSFEIYVPEARRRWGYYVLPFLLGDSLVARVDLKADRQRRVLVAAGAYAEPGVDRAAVAAELGDQLQSMASWLSLDGVEATGRGDLLPPTA